jgi:hypothetical protein
MSMSSHTAFTTAAESDPPPYAFSPSLPLGAAIRDVFRCGDVYGFTARNGAPAARLELFDRNHAVTGAALWSEVAHLPVPGSTVEIEGVLIATSSGKPAIWVKRCDPVQVLDHAVCIFEKVPAAWVCNPTVLDNAIILWNALSRPYRRALNAVFRSPELLRAFLIAPGSLHHHHNHRGGCFEHSVTTAQWGLDQARQDGTLSADMVVFCLLVHDVGKALEYLQNGRGNWQMSQRGRLIGHKITTVTLVAEAMGYCPDLSAHEQTHVEHVLSSSYAPQWAGFRRPQTKEARVVAALDALSAAVAYNG